MDIAQAWQGLTQGQGTVLGALITVIAALGGVVLGWLLFSGRVRNLEGALKASEEKVQNHIKNVELSFTAYEEKLNVQLASLSQQLGNLSGSVADIPTSSPGVIAPEQQTAQDSMRECWGRIRNRLEQIASDPNIDGRTRAKYDRIDRRRYGDLVNALAHDGRLGADQTFYSRAVELWLTFRTGRATPSPSEVKEMQDLAERLNA